MGIPETVRAAMRQINDLFDSQVVGKTDIDALDRVYTVNARILPPGAEMIEGRERIKSFWQQAIAGLAIKSAKLTTVDAEAAGDSIVEIGRAELIVGDSDQAVMVKYVVHWKQEDGKWKWHVDIWNMN
jgi:ketosteroid isomerase-like protein